MLNKPRKPLSSLFARTENVVNVTEEPKAAPARVVDEVKHESKPITQPIEAKPSEAPLAPTKEKKMIEVKIEAKSQPVPEVQPVQHMGADASATLNDALRTLQRNFLEQKAVRAQWNESQYTEFIRRLDAAQTEAFFLKGKLLEEVKRRFFEENKLGWKSYCEEMLRMNYTTANQYIRVSQEFDVMSHHRPDFGFEHFKALLPLEPETRKELIQSLPQISVKKLRDLVQSKLDADPTRATREQTVQAKNLIKLLEQLKQEMFSLESSTLAQVQKWQLSAACRNLSQELFQLSEELNGLRDKKINTESHRRDEQTI